MSQEYYHFSHRLNVYMTIDPQQSFATLYYNAFAWPFIGTLALAALAATALIGMICTWLFAGRRGAPDWVARFPALVLGMTLTIGIGGLIILGVGGLFVILYYLSIGALLVAAKLFLGWIIALVSLGLALLILKLAMGLLMALFILIAAGLAIIFGLRMPFRKL
jgi:hypothetical protein